MTGLTAGTCTTPHHRVQTAARDVPTRSLSAATGTGESVWPALEGTLCSVQELKTAD